MKLLLGENPALLTGSPRPGRKLKAEGASGLLPFFEAPSDRLGAALGAALALKQATGSNMVLVFVDDGEVNAKLWRRTLSVAAKYELPIMFAVVPSSDHEGHPQLTKIAHGCGVAGIAVEATDAIAMYRVAQESMGRIRGGGGPVLVEGIHFRLPVDKARKTIDPVAAMRKCVLDRKAATAAWVDRVERAFLKILATKAKVPAAGLLKRN
jgi:TPP-dependent pyruvate/acetoin dehydrogenase alpha subunit